MKIIAVTPAKAGAQNLKQKNALESFVQDWVPAFAGMTERASA